MFPRYSYQDFQKDLDFFYDYFWELRKEVPDSECLIREFYNLFIDGSSYPVAEVLQPLHRIVDSPWAFQEFNYFLNRCCYIFINYWWSQSEYQSAHNLVTLFQQPASRAITPTTWRLRELVKQFTRSKQYQELQRYSFVASSSTTENKEQSGKSSRPRPLKDFVHRYPCLYEHYVLDSSSNELGRNAISRIQSERQRKFEQDLLSYAPTLLQNRKGASQNPGGRRATKNPTQLTDRQLETAIRNYVGPVEADRTYRDSAQQFLHNAARTGDTYRTVKRQMREYMLDTIRYSPATKYCQKSHFTNWLDEQLKNIFPLSDNEPPTPSLLVKTCGHFTNSLIAAPSYDPKNHAMFLDLHANLGATWTVAILLKVTLVCQLLCQNARDILELVKARIIRHFAVLFRHYENHSHSEAQWLTDCLEHLMVAFTIHFGQESYSTWKALL
jgi:hypothetical protein